jgi:hypothetical protein
MAIFRWSEGWLRVRDDNQDGCLTHALDGKESVTLGREPDILTGEFTALGVFERTFDDFRWYQESSRACSADRLTVGLEPLPDDPL